MSGGIVFGQMIIMFALMMIGFVFYKRKMVSVNAGKDLSCLVVNLCSPALVVASVLGETTQVTRNSVVVFTGIALICFLAMILLGYLLTWLLRVPKEENSAYHLMTIFGNVGFIGIPITSALFGTGPLVYAAAFSLVFNLMIYTYGIYLIQKGTEKEKQKFRIGTLFNPGTISCLLTIVIFWFQIPVIAPIRDFFHYMGQSATFLSLFVIGTSLAQINLVEMIQDKRLFFFTILRFILFPVLVIKIMQIFTDDRMMQGALAIMVAVPVGNLPAMLAKQYNRRETTITRGILYTTLFSVITITVTCMFL